MIWNNSLKIDMSLHYTILILNRLFLNAVWIAEKQLIPFILVFFNLNRTYTHNLMHLREKGE